MIKFLHGADLHLDSPFAFLPPEEAAQCRAMQRELPRKLSDLAVRHGCAFILLAGDVFDGIPYPETLDRLRQDLAACPVPVIIAPGNHDLPECGIWDGSWPENVHIFKDAGTKVLEQLGVCIHHGTMEQLQAQDDGYVHIGLIHGDPESNGLGCWPTDQAVAATGLDYLALGHIHKTSMPRKVGNTWFGWPGIPMGRGFDETGEKGVLCVELSQGSCRGEFLVIDAPRYEIYTLPASEQWQVPHDSGNIRARLCLVGQAESAEPEKVYRQYASAFLSLEVRDETEPAMDLWDACSDGTLRGLALDALREEPDEALAELAARFLLAALEGRESP